MNAGDTQARWIAAIGQAQVLIRISCFTFDSPTVVAALLSARARGVEVKLIFSDRDRGLTRNQEPRLQQLRAAGAEVRAHTAARLHTKWMLADSTLVLGSTNFTEASQGNVERSVAIARLPREQLAAEAAWYDRLFAVSAVYTSGIGARTPQRRQ